jgi:glyoxylase-like metal-dependent hydrolase (beta-lactamase superfamily II)
MLEDDFTYVLRKALKGLALTTGEAALRAGIAESAVAAFAGGQFSAATARALAPALGLKPEAFAKHVDYLPQPLHLHTIRRLDLPFEDGQVNAWLIREDDTTVLIDSGFQPGSCLAVLDALGCPKPDAVFITHSHRDHLGDLTALLARGCPAYGWEIEGCQPVFPGDARRIGQLAIRACDLSGHANPALGYHIEGLTRPVFATGDALFAGSIGGCATPQLYQNALHHLQLALSALPDRTLLLPGHGPATTLGEERQSNPFPVVLGV